MGDQRHFGTGAGAGETGVKKTPVLMVDDDVELVELTREYLSSHGFEVRAVHAGEEALEALQRGPAALVLLDVMLPGIDGFEVCRRIRQAGVIPILMLTARGDETDRIVGLEMGADDYLAKPFNPRELLARIKAILRRTERSSGAGADQISAAADDRLVVGQLTLDMGARTATVRGELVEFTTAEFDLLHLLMSSAGRVLSRDQLMEQLHGTEWAYYDRSIDVHVSRIRQKIEENPRQPRLLKTIRGVGYQFIRSGEGAGS